MGPTSDRYLKSRGWCFTINNYTDDDIDKLNQVECQYLIYGREVAPSTGTPHLQGYIHFSNETTLRAVAKKVIPRGHYEKRLGTIQEAIDYCKKDGMVTERGTISTKATKSDEWGRVVQLAESGSLSELKEEYPRIYLTHYKTILSIRAFKSRPLDGDLEHEWWCGPTGTGKSMTLWKDYPGHYQKPVNKWWDGYAGEEVVAIEEWEPKNECTASKLKIWADRYPFPAEIKGGTIQRIRPKKIIVTSNYTIRECFPNEQDYGPLERRFKQVHFNLRVNGPPVHEDNGEWFSEVDQFVNEIDATEGLLQLTQEDLNIEI